MPVHIYCIRPTSWSQKLRISILINYSLSHQCKKMWLFSSYFVWEFSRLVLECMFRFICMSVCMVHLCVYGIRAVLIKLTVLTVQRSNILTISDYIDLAKISVISCLIRVLNMSKNIVLHFGVVAFTSYALVIALLTASRLLKIVVYKNVEPG